MACADAGLAVLLPMVATPLAPADSERGCGGGRLEADGSPLACFKILKGGFCATGWAKVAEAREREGLDAGARDDADLTLTPPPSPPLALPKPDT